jgi:hypothetical protein
MITHYKVNEAAMLSNGSVMISGSIIAGPRLAIGQEGTTITSEQSIRVLVVGTGVVNPNLTPPDRQGIVAKLLQGDVESLKRLTLAFGERMEAAG